MTNKFQITIAKSQIRSKTKCPGLNWDTAARVSRIDEVIRAGCCVCASICPAGAIGKKEVA
jgi:indolepyruvate ferredoxin oxidoreductase alpha subunit